MSDTSAPTTKPLYEHPSGEVNDPNWPLADVVSTDTPPKTLYHFANDTVGEPPTGASAEWIVYTGGTQVGQPAQPAAQAPSQPTQAGQTSDTASGTSSGAPAATDAPPVDSDAQAKIDAAANLALPQTAQATNTPTDDGKAVIDPVDTDAYPETPPVVDDRPGAMDVWAMQAANGQNQTKEESTS